MTHESSPVVTIYQIAAHVKLSPATVSSVLANRHVERRIATKTVEKVRQAARALGYVPNMAGRRLRAHRASTRQFDLAIMTSFEAPLPLVGQLLHRLQSAVDRKTTQETRYAISIEMFHAGQLQHKPALLDAHRYHGVFVTNTLPEDDRFLAQARLPYPVVVLGRRIPNYYCVLEAPGFVGRRSAEVLLEAGSRNPVILHGRLLTHTTADRRTAFVQTVTERTGKAPELLVSQGLHPSQGEAALEVFLIQGGKIDGLFTVNDSLALGAYQALKRAGRHVPGDVMVVGVGDYELAEYLDPPLSTVAGANDAMVDEAVPMLFRLLRGEEDMAREILVVPPVLLRASTQREG